MGARQCVRTARGTVRALARRADGDDRDLVRPPKTFHPGALAYCTLRERGRTVHRVRLGRPVDEHERAWTGTALCTVRPSGLWFPASPSIVRASTPCPGCEHEYTRQGARHE
jgi:hypothetical protein